MQTPEQIAQAFAALKRGRRAEYVGGGRIRVWSAFTTGTPCPYYITTTEARAAINKATGA